ncbi:hypothetical protein RchiOBHm_Chr5g0012051 [Rosa chinensis]|uniref:Uncharacterized protein n=1 Tax=Rosa chinensis TaxID=74649 RepID=A0A2P6Q519_ROSCH|nr:hypothetical protein RchiOBHm_Chr5g0012051 [Rosa chinensis]
MRVLDSIPNPEFFLAFSPRSSNSPDHLSCEHFGAFLANVEELNAHEQRKEVNEMMVSNKGWIAILSVVMESKHVRNNRVQITA